MSHATLAWSAHIHDVGPRGTGGVFKVGHEDASAAVERVNDHLARHGSRDLHAAVEQVCGRLGATPVRVAHVARLVEEGGQHAAVKGALPLLARLQQQPPLCLKLARSLVRVQWRTGECETGRGGAGRTRRCSATRSARAGSLSRSAKRGRSGPKKVTREPSTSTERVAMAAERQVADRVARRAFAHYIGLTSVSLSRSTVQ